MRGKAWISVRLRRYWNGRTYQYISSGTGQIFHLAEVHDEDRPTEWVDDLPLCGRRLRPGSDYVPDRQWAMYRDTVTVGLNPCQRCRELMEEG